MEWQIIVAVVVGIPIILLPVALVWFINVSGVYAAMKEMRKREATRKKRALETEPVKS